MHTFRFEFALPIIAGTFDAARCPKLQRARFSKLTIDAEVAAELFTNAAGTGEVSMRFTKSGSEELKSSVISQQAEKSQENFGISALTRCLVDADGNATTGAGRARRKALGVSALVQFCTLTALLIVPLFATGSRLILRATNFVPLPPYGGAQKRDLPRTQQSPTRTHNTPVFTRFRDPVQAPIRPPTKIPPTVEMDSHVGGSSAPILLGNQVNGAGSDGPPNLLDGLGDAPGPQPPRPEIAPMPPPRKPITVSQGVQLALLTHRVEPVYPNFARQTRREGTVELRATISSDGAVKDLQVLSGDPVLAQAAHDAVGQWRFRPTLLNGIAVEVITFVTVKFHIDQ
jgi:periplasmic protein TonB